MRHTHTHPWSRMNKLILGGGGAFVSTSRIASITWKRSLYTPILMLDSLHKHTFLIHAYGSVSLTRTQYCHTLQTNVRHSAVECLFSSFAWVYNSAPLNIAKLIKVPWNWFALRDYPYSSRAWVEKVKAIKMQVQNNASCQEKTMFIMWKAAVWGKDWRHANKMLFTAVITIIVTFFMTWNYPEIEWD